MCRHLLRDIRQLTKPLRFEVDDVLESPDRAVIIGKLATRIRSTGRTTCSLFATALTIPGETITRFQMLEDSIGVSRAARE